MASLGFVGKALGGGFKSVASKVKAAAKSVVDEPTRSSQKAAKAAKSKATPSATVSSSTAPTRTSSVLLRDAGITPRVAPSIIPVAARRVRSVDTQDFMQAARAPQVAPASRPFGMPSRLYTTAPTATPPAPAPAAPALASQVDETAGVAAEAARRLAPGRVAAVAPFVAPFVPAAGVEIAESAGFEVPGPLKGAANIATIIGGGALLRKARPLVSAVGRNEIKNLPTKTAKVSAVAKAALPAALGGYIAKEGFQGLTTPPAAAAEADTTTVTPPVEETVLPPIGGTVLEEGAVGGPSAEQEVLDAINTAIGRLESGAGTKNDADTVASGETAILDKSVSDALAALEAAYGGSAAVAEAVTAGDPILLQQLASIDADYQAGLLQIKGAYAGALAQVEGYQTQADALLKEVAAEQMAGFEAAAGGLEAMSPGTGLTGSQAAAAGVSDTALGGAGITGAALARGIAGAASAQAAADRLRLGTDLGGQLATGRLTQADLEAGLSRAALGEKAAARTEAAKREADARALAKEQKRADAIRIAELKYQAALDKQAEATRKEENEAARKQRIAELKMNAELDLAMKVAAMTPAERAAYKASAAGSKKFTAPSWYGKRDPRNANEPLDGKTKDADGVPYTVGQAQRAQDLLDAQLQQPEAQDPATAYAVWTDFFDKAGEANKIYTATGRPASAGAMVKQLFGGSTPKK